jgi:hypothetical protein
MVLLLAKIYKAVPRTNKPSHQRPTSSETLLASTHQLTDHLMGGDRCEGYLRVAKGNDCYAVASVAYDRCIIDNK